MIGRYYFYRILSEKMTEGCKESYVHEGVIESKSFFPRPDEVFRKLIDSLKIELKGQKFTVQDFRRIK